MKIDEMIDGLVAGRVLEYPIPKNICESEDLSALRLLIRSQGYELPAWPPTNYCGTHYLLTIDTKELPHG